MRDPSFVSSPGPRSGSRLTGRPLENEDRARPRASGDRALTEDMDSRISALDHMRRSALAPLLRLPALALRARRPQLLARSETSDASMAVKAAIVSGARPDLAEGDCCAAGWVPVHSATCDRSCFASGRTARTAMPAGLERPALPPAQRERESPSLEIGPPVRDSPGP